MYMQYFSHDPKECGSVPQDSKNAIDPHLKNARREKNCTCDYNMNPFTKVQVS